MDLVEFYQKRSLKLENDMSEKKISRYPVPEIADLPEDFIS
ncbi:hypothetical protein [Maridesulfovibrio sp.]